MEAAAAAAAGLLYLRLQLRCQAAVWDALHWHATTAAKTSGYYTADIGSYALACSTVGSLEPRACSTAWRDSGVASQRSISSALMFTVAWTAGRTCSD